MADATALVPGHEHTEDCWALYREWRRYHAVAEDTTRAFTPNQRLEALHTRDMFGRQLRALGCSAEALRLDEPIEAPEAHGRPPF